jgi:putative hydrolase of the HAD superfamily
MTAILFDLYGTLIDIYTNENKDDFWIKFSKYSKKYKKYNPIELKNKYLETCAKYQNEKEEIDIKDVFKEMFSIDGEKLNKLCIKFRKLSTGYINCYSGAKKLLAKLKENNYKIYVLSNAQEAFTMPELEKLGILECFDGIAISSKYGIKKPNKEFFEQAINDFNINGPDIIMIGNDYHCDIKPAKELGLKTIFIETNLTPITPEKKNVYGFDGEFIFSLIEKMKQI